ncbi:MAG: DNA/RNA non-specific endonuclease [Flavobacteriaceae bacterium]|nr:DNA/RNA non-specific endonuclease [Flavobacteriaceae bacterium]
MKAQRKFLYPVLLILVAATFYFAEDLIDQKKSPEIIPPLAFKQLLPTSTKNQLIHHEGFSLSYREDHEQAEWTAHLLKQSDISYHRFDRPYFEQDPKVRTESAPWWSYKNSGYDRGHLVPAADRKQDYTRYKETFYTSNVSPQNPEFNAGIWNRLEQKVRYWAEHYGEVLVISGGVLSEDLPQIGEAGVSVPAYFYKVIYRAHPEPKAVAFLMPHEASEKALYEFVVSIDSIEMLTGIDFFHTLKIEDQQKLEAQTDLKAWVFIE